jgi:hypothetical protein
MWSKSGGIATEGLEWLEDEAKLNGGVMRYFGLMLRLTDHNN